MVSACIVYCCIWLWRPESQRIPAAPLIAPPAPCCCPNRRCRGQTTPLQPSISPEPVAHLAQHRLLPLLVEAARQQPNIELRMGHRCVHGGRGRYSWRATE